MLNKTHPLANLSLASQAAQLGPQESAAWQRWAEQAVVKQTKHPVSMVPPWKHERFSCENGHTMLAELGCVDRDLREPLHGLACQYLATIDAIGHFVRYIGAETQPRRWHGLWNDTEERSLVSRQIASYEVAHHYEISKNAGPCRTVVGYADLTFSLVVKGQYSFVRRRWQERPIGGAATWTDWHVVRDYEHCVRCRHGIEVKITPVDITDIVVQLDRYRSHSSIKDWTVVTAYGLPACDIELLRSENIRHFRLGAKFDDYLALRRKEDVLPSLEI